MPDQSQPDQSRPAPSGPDAPGPGAWTPEPSDGAAAGWQAGSATDPFTAYREVAALRPTEPVVTSPAPARRGRAMSAVLGGALLLGLVGTGGYVAYEKVLGGGGAQPESALPATSLAFAKVDLDPSGTQKIDAFRFARKFPAAPADVTKDDGDLKRVIFELAQKSGALKGADYAKDVKPWLGDRFGVAVLPPVSGEDPVIVAALAVTDAATAKSSLAKLADGDAVCTVVKEYALCSDTQASLDTAVSAAAKESLAQSKTYAADLADLGEDGILTFWSDGARSAQWLKQATGQKLPIGAAPSGRMIGALRFDGADLELVGKGIGGTKGPAGTTANRVGSLPADTVAAVAVSGAADWLKQTWPELDRVLTAQSPGLLDQVKDQSGLTLPDDLYTVLGNELVIAFGGLDAGGAPKVALVNDSATSDVEAVRSTLATTLGELPLTVRGADGRTIVSMDDGAYAQAVAAGSGLGASATFTGAVPDASGASVVGFVDVGKVLDLAGSDISAEDRKNVEVLRAVGLSVTTSKAGMDFRLRLTTK